MPSKDDLWILAEVRQEGYNLAGMGVVERESDVWSQCYLFEHSDGGDREHYRFYVRELPTFPCDEEYVIHAARSAAERHGVAYYGKLPRGSRSGDVPPWQADAGHLSADINPFSEPRQSAEIAFHYGYEVRDKAKMEEALTALVVQLFELLGESQHFQQFFEIVDMVKRAVESDDWGSGTAPLLAVLAKLRMLEASVDAKRK